ncbi:class I SAM-dependent methyltransferase [Thermosynechococcaceae cyanobacterium BACA0444]|uniref:Class I SAM-dependent methyltransferase n=1 Tax=Pseudocalidococcus azoricus BACA0444 TaxID=2918990 RepID=A0AAE4FRI6_9CYAN|nr:class I SAM-dependent methyltransferase [Pseudocalidococcus azoricus]MDS3860423.1 class I SAM-dependent methyltransferase [Pseudocalidococcus azoricus BACA0444]
MAEYDTIANLFQASRNLPFRWHSEAYTYLNLIGNVTGLKILDLACGEGVYSRYFKQQGAAQVVGVDISPEMIALARAAEIQNPFGVEYLVADVTELGKIGEFDLVVSSYLVNHAPDRPTLLKMLQAIARNLHPQGRTINITNNLGQAPETFNICAPYGFTKTAQLPLTEGTPLEVGFILPDGTEFKVIDFYLSPRTYEQTFLQAGFAPIDWIDPEVSPEGIQEWGESYWQDWLTHKPITIISTQLI